MIRASRRPSPRRHEETAHDPPSNDSLSAYHRNSPGRGHLFARCSSGQACRCRRLQGGISSCFDIAKGDTLWKLSRIGNLGDYYSSPIAGDGKIYVTGENGFIVVLAQGEKLEVLARNDMGEPCVATPALADGRIYIRTREKIFCIGEQ